MKPPLFILALGLCALAAQPVDPVQAVRQAYQSPPCAVGISLRDTTGKVYAQVKELQAQLDAIKAAQKKAEKK
jgi:hypothetical protein